jgi:DNA modification methylase
MSAKISSHAEVTDDSLPNGTVHTDCWSGTFQQTGAKWKVLCGDAVQVVKSLPRNSFHCVITSPPYFWQRDYGVQGQIGVEPTVDGYVSAICDVMDQVKEALHPKGVMFLNLGDTYYSGKGKPHGRDKKHAGRRFHELRAVDRSGLGPPKKTILGMPWRVALAMIDRGWILRSPIVWRRENIVPEPNVHDRPWRTYEFIFLFTKSRMYNFNRKALRSLDVEDVWTFESQSKAGRKHPAVFPKELVTRCLDLACVATGPILDPFAGSGTVLKTSLARGIQVVGIDLNRRFCQEMAKSLRQ